MKSLKKQIQSEVNIIKDRIRWSMDLFNHIFCYSLLGLKQNNISSHKYAKKCAPDRNQKYLQFSLLAVISEVKLQPFKPFNIIDTNSLG